MLIEENKPLAPFTTLVDRRARRAGLSRLPAKMRLQRQQPGQSSARRSSLCWAAAAICWSPTRDSAGWCLRMGLRGIRAADAPSQSGQTEQGFIRLQPAKTGTASCERTVNDNCAGVECLAGIPGTVGGTPVQNVGAYGQEVASAIERVRAFDLQERGFVEFPVAECGFAYRRSRFNSVDRGRYIVTRVDYRLTPGGAPAAALRGSAKSSCGAGKRSRRTQPCRSGRRCATRPPVQGDASGRGRSRIAAARAASSRIP